MEYHQNSDKHPAKEAPLMKPQSNNWTPPSGRNVHVDPFVNAARKQCNYFLINNQPTQISNSNNKEKHSLNELAKDSSVTIKEADKWGAIVLFKTLGYINSCEDLLSDTTNYKKVEPRTLNEFMREAKKLISNLHGTCAMFLKNTLLDQPKPAVFYEILKIHQIPEVIKTVMECRNNIDENLSDQTALTLPYNIIFYLRCDQ